MLKIFEDQRLSVGQCVQGVYRGIPHKYPFEAISLKTKKI